MKCSKCGAELSEDTKFCSYCGHKIEVTPPAVEKAQTPPISHAEKTKVDEPKSFADKAKDKGIEIWGNLSLYGKVATASIAVFVLLCLVALLAGKTVAVVIAIVQIVMAVMSVLMHKGIIKLNQRNVWIKWLVLTVAILFAPLNFMSYSWETETSTTVQNPLSVSSRDVATESYDSTETQQSEQTEPPKADIGTLSITKGTEYAYMTDEWNVYIATAISDDIIKVANWDKTMSNSKSVEYDYDVGTFKINDSENGFAWVDDEHTAFVLTFKDKNNSKFKKGGAATFTINISDSDKNKGSDYSKDIACFSYQNDDWHLYRAIPLTETLIKIETWYRGSSAGTFLFGYDLCLIDTSSGDTDFEWTDDEHTSFSITMRDEENKYEWKKETFVVFILENEGYTYFDVKSYLDKWEVGYGEVAVPASASDYKYENYQDVQKDLEDAGFTNITTEILYDIVWGWTKEGEVKSVSIDGRTDYDKGEVFNVGVPIVITYHMKEEENPNKPVETEPSETSMPTETGQPEQPKENEAPVTNLTADNCSDLANLLALCDPSDPSVATFASQYCGKVIEFDGCVAAMQNHESYKTRWDVLLGAGDYDLNSMSGPNFRLTDVNYYDMNVTGGDSVYVGLNVHVVAKVGKYNANTTLFELNIISMEIRN